MDLWIRLLSLLRQRITATNSVKEVVWRSRAHKLHVIVPPRDLYALSQNSPSVVAPKDVKSICRGRAKSSSSCVWGWAVTWCKCVRWEVESNELGAQSNMAIWKVNDTKVFWDTWGADYFVWFSCTGTVAPVHFCKKACVILKPKQQPGSKLGEQSKTKRVFPEYQLYKLHTK